MVVSKTFLDDPGVCRYRSVGVSLGLLRPRCLDCIKEQASRDLVGTGSKALASKFDRRTKLHGCFVRAAVSFEKHAELAMKIRARWFGGDPLF